MRRLLRNTLYTNQKTDDRRLDQLERRIIPGPCLWARAYMTTAMPCPATNTIVPEFQGFSTNAPGLFGTIDTGDHLPFDNNPGDTTIKCASVGGAFIAMCLIRFEDSTDPFEHSGVVQGGNLNALTEGSGGTVTVPTFSFYEPVSANPQSQSVWDTSIGISTPFASTSGPFWSMRATNGVTLGGGADITRDVTFAELTVFAWPTPGSEDEDPRVYGSSI